MFRPLFSTGDCVHDDFGSVDVDSCKLRTFPVASCRVDRAAEGGFVEQKIKAGKDQKQQDGRNGDAVKIPSSQQLEHKAVSQVGDRFSAGIDHRSAAENRHGDQGCDERLQPSFCHQKPADCAKHGSDCQSQKHGGTGRNPAGNHACTEYGA